MKTIPEKLSHISIERPDSGMMCNLVLCLVVALSLLPYPNPVWATPILGSAQNYAILGGTTVTSTGSTVIKGNIGVDPGTAITGFPPGIVTAGGIYGAGGVSHQAQLDALAAYDYLQSFSSTSNLTGQDLGNRTLTPGVYHFDSSAQLTGALFLDFQSNPDAYFIFQIGSTLTTASSSSVNVIDGGALSGLYWLIGSSATLGTNSIFAGNILANQNITLTNSADIPGGRAIALNGAVTMDNNGIFNNSFAEDYGSYGFSGGSETPVPEPATMLLLGSGIAGLAVFRKKSGKAVQK